MSDSNNGPKAFRFRDFVLDVQRGTLLRGTEEVRLRPQSFRVLCYLVENRGRLLSKKELLDAIWGRTVVTEGSLTQCLIDIRRALGDASRELVRTVPRRGYLFDVPVSEVTAERPSPGIAPRRGRRAIASGATIAMLAAAGLVAALGWLRPDPAAESAAVPAPRSIAVLPFADMSEGGGQAFLGEGIAEEILRTLAQSPDLHVIARTSAFSLGDHDTTIRTARERLGVAYVLQGSVRRAGGRVRIGAQMVDAATGEQLWSETFDRHLEDVFEVQSGIAAAVAEALEATLSDDDPPAPADPRAFELYLQARFFHKRRAPGDPALAEAYYRRALALDGTYGPAWAGLAGAYIVLIAEGAFDTPEMRAAWREAVEKALEYAPNLAEAHVRASQYYYWNDADERKVREHRRRAMALAPDDPLVLAVAAGSNGFFGRLDLAIEQYRRAVALDPLSALDHANLAGMLAAAGRFAEAMEEERAALDLNPAYRPQYEKHTGYLLILKARHAEPPEAARRWTEALAAVERWPQGLDRDAALAMIQHATGRRAEADASLERLIAAARHEADAGAALRVAEALAFCGAADEAFRWLAQGRAWMQDKPRLQRAERITALRMSPFLAPLRGDARWEPLVAWES